MSRGRGRSSGFTLLELIIAVSLSSLVLLGLVSISASLVRQQMEGVRKGTATGWSLVSYMKMAKDIESGNVLAWPGTNLQPSDWLVICKNWSRLMTMPPSGGANGGPLDTSAGAQIEVVYYCFDFATPGNGKIRRYARIGAVGSAVACPATATFPAGLPACDGTGTWTQNEVVAIKAERFESQTLVVRDNGIGGLILRYVVGEQAPTTNTPTPVFIPFNVGLTMQKQYNSTAD